MTSMEVTGESNPQSTDYKAVALPVTPCDHKERKCSMVERIGAAPIPDGCKPSMLLLSLTPHMWQWESPTIFNSRHASV